MVKQSLTNDEKAVLIGGILGDEIITKRDSSYRYRVQHIAEVSVPKGTETICEISAIWLR